MCNEVRDLVSNFISEQRLWTFTYKCSVDISSKLCLLYLVSCTAASPFWIISGAEHPTIYPFLISYLSGLVRPAIHVIEDSDHSTVTKNLLIYIRNYYATLVPSWPHHLQSSFFNYLIVLNRLGWGKGHWCLPPSLNLEFRNQWFTLLESSGNS